MVREENNKRITAIVPAYNEAARIGKVLDTLTTYQNFSEIIVVDDGSTDHTEKIAQGYNVRYIKNQSNKGKGYAMDRGVHLAKNNIIFFVDADVIGLTHKIIDEIISPVLEGEVEMFIGMRNRKIYNLHIIMVLIPLLGGERAITKNLWFTLPDYYKHRFRVEAGLNFYAKYYGNGFSYKIFKGLSQVIKEKKYGLFQGMKQRIAMHSNIFFSSLRLQFVDIPQSARNRRLQAFISIQSFIGMMLGALILAIVYFSPNDGAFELLADRLHDYSTIPFVDYLVYLAKITTISTLTAVGLVVLVSNLFIFLFTFKEKWSILSAILQTKKKV